MWEDTNYCIEINDSLTHSQNPQYIQSRNELQLCDMTVFSPQGVSFTADKDSFMLFLVKISTKSRMLILI